MALDMLRSRPLLGFLIGFLGPVLLVAPGCLRTLDESRIGQNHGNPDASAGSGGSAGTDASTGGSGGQVDGGGGVSGDAATDGAADAIVDARPEAGFTAYDKSQHPVTNLAGGTGRRIVAVDNTTVFVTDYSSTYAKATLSSIPLAGGQATIVTSANLSAPQAMVAPSSSLYIYYAGATQTDNGVLGRFLKDPGGSANPEQPITTSTGFGRTVGIVAGNDTYAYVSTRAPVSGAPLVLRFSLAGGVSQAQVLTVADANNQTGGPITMSHGCVYFINNGGVWVLPTAGGSKASPALAKQITDAVDITSDSSNIYYTRSNGEVWQNPLSGKACDGSNAAEQFIAWGYTQIGRIAVYDSTVVWAAAGDASNNFDGGGIFTTPIGGYDVVQIAPQDNGVDDIAVGPNEIVYSTSNGVIRKVKK